MMKDLNEELLRTVTLEDPLHPRNGDRTISLSAVDLDRLLDEARAQGKRIATTGSPYETTFQRSLKP